GVDGGGGRDPPRQPQRPERGVDAEPCGLGGQAPAPPGPGEGVPELHAVRGDLEPRVPDQLPGGMLDHGPEREALPDLVRAVLRDHRGGVLRADGTALAHVPHHLRLAVDAMRGLEIGQLEGPQGDPRAAQREGEGHRASMAVRPARSARGARRWHDGRMSRAALLPPVLLGLVILLLAQMVGLALEQLLGLPVPGVVLGIVLLVLLGVLRPTRSVVRAAEPAATPLLAHLQLLFVPPSVGIVLELESLAENALPLALAVGGSFLVPLIVSGAVLQALLRRQDRRR